MPRRPFEFSVLVSCIEHYKARQSVVRGGMGTYRGTSKYLLKFAARDSENVSRESGVAGDEGQMLAAFSFHLQGPQIVAP